MKLRKMTIGEDLYLYKISSKVSPEALIRVLYIKVFLSGWKQTPLELDFATWNDAMIGYPLNSGFPLQNLLTGHEEIINLNRPKYIRKCILYGLKNGWNGKNNLEILDGLKMMEDLGYNVSVLIPKL